MCMWRGGVGEEGCNNEYLYYGHLSLISQFQKGKASLFALLDIELGEVAPRVDQ